MTEQPPSPARRQTAQQRAVRETLREAGGFVSAQQLHRMLRDAGVRAITSSASAADGLSTSPRRSATGWTGPRSSTASGSPTTRWRSSDCASRAHPLTEPGPVDRDPAQ
jgi:hypothetical protein